MLELLNTFAVPLFGAFGMAWVATKNFVGGQVLTESDLDNISNDLDVLKIIHDDDGNLRLAASEVTIASGAVTVSGNFHTVDTQSNAATDDLDTITPAANMENGTLLLLLPASGSRTPTLKHGTGNIVLQGGMSCSLFEARSSILLVLTAGPAWVEINRGNLYSLFDPAVATTASSSTAQTTYNSWTGLDLTTWVPAGCRAAILLVRGTTAAGSVWEVRKDSSSAVAGSGDLSSAELAMSTGWREVICPVDTSGQIEYRYGNGNAAGGAITVGIEVKVKGWIA